jgi:hypothetical protein
VRLLLEVAGALCRKQGVVEQRLVGAEAVGPVREVV